MVETEADRAIESFKKHLDNAISDLSRFIVDRCWGYDDYKSESRSRYRRHLATLLGIREDIS